MSTHVFVHSSIQELKLVASKLSVLKNCPFHQWKDKARGIQWMQEEVLNASVDTKDAAVWQIMFHTGSLGMTVYLENLCSDTVTDIVIPRIRPLLGQTGKIRRLNPQEVNAVLTQSCKRKLPPLEEGSGVRSHC